MVRCSCNISHMHCMITTNIFPTNFSNSPSYISYAGSTLTAFAGPNRGTVNCLSWPGELISPPALILRISASASPKYQVH